MLSSRGSSQPRDRTGIFPAQGSNACLLWLLYCGRIFYPWATREALSPSRAHQFQLEMWLWDKNFPSLSCSWAWPVTHLIRRDRRRSVTGDDLYVASSLPRPWSMELVSSHLGPRGWEEQLRASQKGTIPQALLLRSLQHQLDILILHSKERWN